MNEHDILDAPESHQKVLKIPFLLILKYIAIFSVAFGFTLYATFELNVYKISFSLYEFPIRSFTLIYPMIICFGLYFFNRAVQADNKWFFRMVTTAVSIIFVSCVIALFFFTWMMTLLEIVPSDTHITTFLLFRDAVYIALVGGVGCSLAVRFLLKKNYLVFSGHLPGD